MALPWQDRSGEFSAIRAAALSLVSAPALWLALAVPSGWLGPRLITIATHETGDWAIRFLLLTLLVSPLRRLLNWPRLIAARQIFGLASFAYALVHVLLYLVDLKGDVFKFASEIVQRLYLGIGAVGFIGLLLLAVNSGESAVRRLGGEGWNRLHKAIYGIVPLALVHFFIQSKLDVTQPVLLSGFAIWLLGYRRLPKAAQTAPVPLIGLALAAAVGTQLVELLWYAVATKVSVSGIAAGIFEFDYEIRMIWYVLVITLIGPLGAVWLAPRIGRQVHARTMKPL